MEIVDYLDYMYCHQYILGSKKPVPIASYDTIVNPFDFFTWICTFASIISQFLLLLLLQNIWCHVSGKVKPEDYVYEGFIKFHLYTTGPYKKVKAFFRFLSVNRTNSKTETAKMVQQGWV